MKLLNKRNTSLGLMGLLISPILFCIISVSSNLLIVKQQQVDNSTSIELAQQQITDITIISTFPELIWIEGQMTLLVTSNITGSLNCIFGDPELKSFNLGNTNHNILGNNMPQTILLRISPNLFTLPGKYNLELLITLEGSSDQHSEHLEVSLGMGYVFLLCILLVFGTAIIVILSIKQEIDEEILATMSSGSATGINTQGGANIPAGKIKCPECRKLIDEGLRFCPECGERIPEFLSFGPTSTS